MSMISAALTDELTKQLTGPATNESMFGYMLNEVRYAAGDNFGVHDVELVYSYGFPTMWSDEEPGVEVIFKVTPADAGTFQRAVPIDGEKLVE